jgi:hypothetical protein
MGTLLWYDIGTRSLVVSVQLERQSGLRADSSVMPVALACQ